MVGFCFGVEEALDVAFGWRTGNESAMTFCAAAVMASGVSRASRARAWPKVSSPDSTWCWIGSGNFNKRRKLETAGAVFAGARGHLFLGHLEVLAKAMIGAGLLHGVQVGALQVLDDGHLHRLLIGHFADDGWDGFFAGACGGQPAALAGDELVAVLPASRLHDNRLDDSGGGDGLGQLGELGFVEVGAGLEGVAVDLLEGDFQRLAGCVWWCRGCGVVRSGRGGGIRGLCRGRGAWDRGWSAVVVTC